jgi:hypothetical protein
MITRERRFKIRGIANVLENNARHAGIRMSRENGLAMAEAAQMMRELLAEVNSLQTEQEGLVHECCEHEPQREALAEVRTELGKAQNRMVELETERDQARNAVGTLAKVADDLNFRYPCRREDGDCRQTCKPTLPECVDPCPFRDGAESLIEWAYKSTGGTVPAAEPQAGETLALDLVPRKALDTACTRILKMSRWMGCPNDVTGCDQVGTREDRIKCVKCVGDSVLRAVQAAEQQAGEGDPK